MESTLAAVSSVGFPIIVSVYLLTKFTATIERLSAEVGRLSISIDRLDEREGLRRMVETGAAPTITQHQPGRRDL